MIKDPILIVDDEVEMRIAMSETLKHCGYPVELSHNAIDAFKKFKDNDYSLVITDMTMPKRSGLELLKDIKALKPNKPVVMVTAYGTIETAIEAMKQGAFDYILKPFNFETFTFVVERALAYKEQTKSSKESEEQTKKNKSSEKNYKEIITQNKQMLEFLEVAKNVANSKATILIQSESGTGKELLSQFIHLNSNRANNPFIAINCAALPDTLLESELFGYKKGAFTGALSDHKGLFEQANGGTILLDEISEMALPLQAKLLRILQEREVQRVGGGPTTPIDVRVIATTNRNMLGIIEEGKFREDLYFRLNVIPLELPPLRNRKDDIPLLIEYFLKKHSLLNQRDIPTISQETVDVLMHYNWRGNIRELENVVERALLLSNGNEILPSALLMSSVPIKNLPISATTASTPDSTVPIFSVNSLTGSNTNSSADSGVGIEVGMSMKEAEKKLIVQTLKENDDNRTQAAKILGISIRTLRNKLNEYKLEDENFEFEVEK